MQNKHISVQHPHWTQGQKSVQEFHQKTVLFSSVLFVLLASPLAEHVGEEAMRTMLSKHIYCSITNLPHVLHIPFTSAQYSLHI